MRVESQEERVEYRRLSGKAGDPRYDLDPILLIPSVCGQGRPLPWRSYEAPSCRRPLPSKGRPTALCIQARLEPWLPF